VARKRTSTMSLQGREETIWGLTERNRRVRLGDSLRGAKQFQAIYFLMESSST